MTRPRKASEVRRLVIVAACGFRACIKPDSIIYRLVIYYSSLATRDYDYATYTSGNCHKTFHFVALFPLAASEAGKVTLPAGLNSRLKHEY
jgi:hypothetical protein